MNFADHISESLDNYLLGLKILKFFDADPNPGWKILIRDPGKLNIVDP